MTILALRWESRLSGSRDHPFHRPPQRHMKAGKSRVLILFWPLSGLVIYSGRFLARGLAWVFIHLFHRLPCYVRWAVEPAQRAAAEKIPERRLFAKFSVGAGWGWCMEVGGLFAVPTWHLFIRRKPGFILFIMPLWGPRVDSADISPISQPWRPPAIRVTAQALPGSWVAAKGLITGAGGHFWPCGAFLLGLQMCCFQHP